MGIDGGKESGQELDTSTLHPSSNHLIFSPTLTRHPFYGLIWTIHVRSHQRERSGPASIRVIAHFSGPVPGGTADHAEDGWIFTDTWHQQRAKPSFWR